MWAPSESDRMDRIDGDMLEIVRALLDSGEPAWTTPEIAELVDREEQRRDVMRDLERLVWAGILETKNPGGRSRLWWLEGTRQPRGEEAPAPLVEVVAELEVGDDRGDDAGDRYLEALEGWEPGRSDDEGANKREAAAAVLEWLDERGEPASKSDVLDARGDGLVPDPDVTGITFWTDWIRPALNHAAETGAVEKPGKWSYAWVDGDH